MSGVLPVWGPLVWPASTSGVHFLTCTHQAPDACPGCDGTRLTGAEHDNAPLPACMRKEET